MYFKVERIPKTDILLILKTQRLVHYLISLFFTFTLVNLPVCAEPWVTDFDNEELALYHNLSKCVLLNEKWVYAGDLKIPVNKLKLKDNELMDEAHFAAYIQVNLKKASEKYKQMQGTLKGILLDLDLIRELYPQYEKISFNYPASVRATHVPAGIFLNYLYENLKYTYNKKKTPHLVLLAGGDGSGKTTMLKTVAYSLVLQADIIRDGTMRNFNLYKNIINEALVQGFRVEILYIFRPIEKSLENILERLQKGHNRARPLFELMDSHFNSQQNVLKFHELYGSAINIRVIDNSGSITEAHFVENPIDFLNSPTVKYTSENSVLERLIVAYGNFKNSISKNMIDLLESDLLDRK